VPADRLVSAHGCGLVRVLWLPFILVRRSIDVDVIEVLGEDDGGTAGAGSAMRTLPLPDVLRDRASLSLSLS
jgi:hypothetical protein